MATRTQNDRTAWNAESTFLTRRPRLGEAWIVDLATATTGETTLMRTLQGMVNRTEARLYLVSPHDSTFREAEEFWIAEYERRGWVRIAGQITVDEAIERFASEVRGFVSATEAEPWSIHAAAALAMRHNGVVATDDTADRLLRSGWSELGSTRGRWPDAVSGFQAMVAEHGEHLAYPGVALLRHTDPLWDFVVQQEIMPLFTRPKHDTWEGVAAIIDAYPAGQVLYGYVSDDTVEEEIAVERTSTTGKYLVPTQQVSNLSFHVAVEATEPLRPTESVVPDSTEPDEIPGFDPGAVNVAIAITDGDNLQVPIQQYPQSSFWNCPNRGSMPLGWSMGLGLSILAPGIWEFYRSTMRPNDEVVSIMGIAYVHASTLPSPADYYRDTFAAMRDMGIGTLWSLDSSLTITDEPLWETLETAPGRDALRGVLVGYGPSIDKAFRRDTGTPVLITQNGYSENPQRIRERVEALLAMDPADRSPVNFLMATNWTSTAEELYEALRPLEAKGVRFLTPGQALACMPAIEGKARSSGRGEAAPGECAPTGPLEQFGSPILSAPTLAEVSAPAPFPIEVSVDAPTSVEPGEPFDFAASVEVDVIGLARGFLEERVLPVVEGYGLSEEFAEDAWTKLAIDELEVRIPLPGGLSGLQILDSKDAHSAIEHDEEGGRLAIRIDSFTADSRRETASVRAAVRCTATHTKAEGARELLVGPEAMSFAFALTIGIGDEAGPLVGGVRGRMTCCGAQPLARVAG